MQDAVSTFCSQGVGYHERSARRQVTFSGSLLAFVLGRGSLTGAFHGVVWRDTTCDSCKRHYIWVDWLYYDVIDWNSFSQLYNALPKDSTLYERAGAVLEGLLHVYGDVPFAAAYKLYAPWWEDRSACCP
jgi:hypothetical protein